MKPRRSRRTYSCGPCKRYKMKCNLELPCLLCIRTRREHQCRENPPNPPSEKERIVQQERRSRNSRRKDRLRHEVESSDELPHSRLGLSSHAPKHVYGNPIPLFGSVQHTPPWALLMDHLPQLLLLLPPDHLLPFLPHATGAPNLPTGLPLPDQTPPRSIHNLGPMLHYIAQCQAKKVDVPPAAFTRWQNLQPHAPPLAVAFNWAHLIENLGFHELVDWTSVYAAAQKMLVSSFQVTDKHTLQCMALAAAFFAAGCLAGPRVSKKAVLRCNEWLTLLSVLVKALDQSTWEDAVFSIVHVILLKTTLMALAQFERVAREFRKLFRAISQNTLFLLLVHELEYLKLPPDRAEEFAVLARCWTYIKLVETEALVLQAETLFQYEHAELKDTIQPDRDLVKWLYGIDPEHPPLTLLIYDTGLIASSLFFRRFENCTSPREISYAYLTLYSEFCAGNRLAAEALFNAMENNDMILAVRSNKSLLGAILKVSFICVRWLLIIRAEPNKFVTLRFAHYVTTLMLMFNPLFAILDSDISSQTLMSSLQNWAQLNTVFDLYNMLTLQALFIAVMKNFTKESTTHWGLDLQWLVDTIKASYSRGRKMLDNVQPYVTLPLASALLLASESLVKMNCHDNHTAQSFYDQITQIIDRPTWNTCVYSLFGLELTAVNYVEQLWRFGEVTKFHGPSPMKITQTLVLNTAFLREFEKSLRGFWFSRRHVEEYLEL